MSNKTILTTLLKLILKVCSIAGIILITTQYSDRFYPVLFFIQNQCLQLTSLPMYFIFGEALATILLRSKRILMEIKAGFKQRFIQSLQQQNTALKANSNPSTATKFGYFIANSLFVVILYPLARILTPENKPFTLVIASLLLLWLSNETFKIFFSLMFSLTFTSLCLSLMIAKKYNKFSTLNNLFTKTISVLLITSIPYILAWKSMQEAEKQEKTNTIFYDLARTSFVILTFIYNMIKLISQPILYTLTQITDISINLINFTLLCTSEISWFVFNAIQDKLIFMFNELYKDINLSIYHYYLKCSSLSLGFTLELINSDFSMSKLENKTKKIIDSYLRTLHKDTDREQNLILNKKNFPPIIQTTKIAARADHQPPAVPQALIPQQDVPFTPAHSA